MTGENSTSLYLTAEEAQKYTANFPPPTITINGGDGTPLVKIHPDGALEYGPHYEPDEAAQAFWEALSAYMPTRCANCGHVGAPAASR